MSAVLPGTTSISPPRAATEAADPPIVDAHEPSAAERLEASRARLRSALLEITHPPPKPSLLSDMRIGSLGHRLLERVKAMPAAGLVIESIEHWWAEHPLHAAGRLAEEATERYVGPVARENPIAAVVGAAVFGALFIASKPWRWLLRPALFIGFVPQIASHALKRMPLDSWLQMLSSVSGRRSTGTSKPAVPPQAAAARPSPGAKSSAAPVRSAAAESASGLPTAH